MIGKSLRKIIQQLFLIFCIPMKKKYFQLILQNITQPVKKEIILLTIANEEEEGWHYFTVKKLSALLHTKTSNHGGDFYCLNCLNCFRTENKFHSHEKIYKNKDFCEIVIPSEKNKVLKFNHYMKSDKMPYIIYADLECLVKK